MNLPKRLLYKKNQMTSLHLNFSKSITSMTTLINNIQKETL